MNTQTFNTFREIVYLNSGINLNASKKAMVASRINKRIRSLNLRNHEEYLHHLLNDESSDEIANFLDVISTNVTSFFREQDHFDFLRDHVTKVIAEGHNKIRIWSAAASTGEEPYSIAMTLGAMHSLEQVDLKILATDISTRVLQAARSGIYAPDKLKHVPRHMIAKFFSVIKCGSDDYYSVSDELKNMIMFRRLNLASVPFPMKGGIDIVFCRNVMIYFDNIIRSRLIAEIYRLLKPGGYLFTGHAESLRSIQTHFQCLRPSIYQKVYS